MITERRGDTQQHSDLLQIMIESEIYNDETIKDEIFGFFFAGMKTIQISTTNLIYYVTKDARVKAKLLAEIIPVCERLEGVLDYDSVMGFDYLQHCFHESLRIESPSPFSLQQMMSQDTTIGPLLLKKGQVFIVMFHEIHHDKAQWR
jgi:cytochrome P450